MILATYTKQPSEVLDYDIDYSPWLLPMGDTLDDIPLPEVVCLTDPTDTSLECREILHTASEAKLWMQGGTAGNKYKVTIKASTVIGRLDESELVFNIKDF